MWKNITFEKVKRFLAPISQNKWVTCHQIIYFTFQYSFWIVFVFFVKDITEILSQKDYTTFISTLWVYSFYFSISIIGVFVSYTWWAYTNERYRQWIEEIYVKKYILFDLNYTEKNGTWKTIAIFSKGIKMWGMLLWNCSVYFTKITLSLWVTIYLLSKIHYFFVLLFFVLIILWGILWLFLNIKTIRERNKRVEIDNLWSKNVVRIISSKVEILQSKKIDSELTKLHDFQEKKIYFNKRMSPYLVPFYVIWNLITGIMLFWVYITFWVSYFEWNISLWYITGVTWALLLMNSVLIDFLDFIKNFWRDFPEIQNLWDFFDDAPEITGYEEWNTFTYQTWNIELQNLTYSYEWNKNVFENFDLKIQWWNITAFVWPSGGGKSTLVKLIAGYLKANSGEILIDGQKLTETSLKSYYQDVGYLTQEPSVFDGTVRENLMYALGEETLDNKHLQHILKLSRCEFISELSQWLDTEIGERGVKLSGGQKQRLAIAKIFLKNPKIIILDEPTSALDSQSEKAITQAMHELFKDRTVLVIAHRLQTVKYANEIIVIDSGKIIERGNHKELVKQKWYYAEMLELQSGF